MKIFVKEYTSDVGGKKSYAASTEKDANLFTAYHSPEVAIVELLKAIIPLEIVKLDN